MFSTWQVIRIAEYHADKMQGDMKSSALLCLDDAKSLYAKCENRRARELAVYSLKYSIGIFHKTYKNCLLRSLNV
jgi:hypothetical protein